MNKFLPSASIVQEVLNMKTYMDRAIRWADGTGNETIISKGVWRAEVLPRALTEHWYDPDLLFFDVMMGSDDGFVEELLPFVQRLLSLEGESERAVACLA